MKPLLSKFWTRLVLGLFGVPLLLFSLTGCGPSPVNNTADQVTYEALRPSHLRLADGAVAAGTMKPEDRDAIARLYDAWALDIKARKAAE